MFFSEDRQHFFRPLNSKYREQVIECLRELYARLYSTMADYSLSYNREQVIQIFQEAIARAPLLDSDSDEDFNAPKRSEREQANWALNQLLEYGWLEKLVDEATLQSTYAFTRYGRMFTQPMVEAAGGRYRTRHRNTRNTRNALQSFLDKGEVHDLLDALEYSERIIADFSDVITELDDKKRQLVKEVEAQQIVQRASDEFFDFMEKRFMPDLAIRLSADSVEKYRDQIQELIDKARRKQKNFKVTAEQELRRSAPELLADPGQSLYLAILDGIEHRMLNASSIMLPALRRALNGFTRRADIIIRQLSYAGGNQRNRLLAVCEHLAKQAPSQQASALSAAGERMAVLNLAYPDPAGLRLQQGRGARVVNSQAEIHRELDQASRKELFIRQSLDTAFSVNNKALADYLVAALKDGQCIHSQDLPVTNARELLMSAHAIEAGMAGRQSSEFRFDIRYSGQDVHTEYFEHTDAFTIELVELNRHVE